ncbi:TPA: hypothetical protein ACHWJ6_001958, partial [Streptococcus suis]
ILLFFNTFIIKESVVILHRDFFRFKAEMEFVLYKTLKLAEPKPSHMLNMNKVYLLSFYSTTTTECLSGVNS